MKNLITWGLVVSVVGGAIAGFSWPETTVTFDGDYQETGQRAGMMFGALVGWVGTTMLAVGLIGQAVRLGRQASPTFPRETMEVGLAGSSTSSPGRRRAEATAPQQAPRSTVRTPKPHSEITPLAPLTD